MDHVIFLMAQSVTPCRLVKKRAALRYPTKYRQSKQPGIFVDVSMLLQTSSRLNLSTTNIYYSSSL